MSDIRKALPMTKYAIHIAAHAWLLKLDNIDIAEKCRRIPWGRTITPADIDFNMDDIRAEAHRLKAGMEKTVAA